MNFQEFEKIALCYNCNSLLNNEYKVRQEELHRLYKCKCEGSFKIFYKIPSSFVIYLPIFSSHTLNYRRTKISIKVDADMGKEYVQIKFLSEEITLLDNSKHFKCDYIPDFLELPKEELINKLNEYLLFI
jgi:hypothetical protein